MLLLALACTAPDSASKLDDTSSEAPAATLTWTEAPHLRSSRDHHVSFAQGDWLYTLAGTDRSGYANTTAERAAIAEDGTLSDFETLDPLSEGRVGPGLAQDGADIVVAGGLLDTSDTTPAVWVIHVGEDGALEFEDGPALVTGRYHAALVLDQGFVYASGGMWQSVTDGFEQVVLDTVERAYFVGGSLGPWEEVATLPEPTTHHTSVVHDHQLYVIGGGDTTQARREIHRAEIDADGSLSAWALAGELPEGRATSAGVVLGDELYLLTGMTSLTGAEVDTVLHATFQADGSLSSFEELTPVPKARAHSHQAPVHDGVIYSIGGSINHVDQKQVYIGRFE